MGRQRSDDGGRTWEAVNNKSVYDGVPGTHQWYDGTPHPWEFKRVWHLEPSLTDADVVYAGVEDAAMFRSDDGGESWKAINRGLRSHHIPEPEAEVGHCVHRLAMHRSRPSVLFMQKHWDVMQTDDSGDTWAPIVRDLPPVMSVEVQTLT